MTEDMLPEEREAQNKELVTLLQGVYRRPAPITPTEQAQIITRVREHLMKSDQEVSPKLSLHEDMPLERAGIEDSSWQESPSSVRTTRRRGRILHVINGLAAVLVIAAIIGTSLLLFRHQPAGAPAVGPVGTPVTAHTRANGLEMSLQITSGPYFLSELLAVDISLTNHTHTTFTLSGSFGTNLCGSAFDLLLIAENRSHYTLPVNSGLGTCPPGMVLLKPGQTITGHGYTPVTDSGHVTLTAKTSFLTNVGPNPLDGHWPSIQINVAEQVPSDRVVSLQQQGSQVFITAPPAARGHLVAMQTLDCQVVPGLGGHETAFYYWKQISTNVLHEPRCPGKTVSWSYAVSAPGYAVASGSSF